MKRPSPRRARSISVGERKPAHLASVQPSQVVETGIVQCLLQTCPFAIGISPVFRGVFGGYLVSRLGDRVSLGGRIIPRPGDRVALGGRLIPRPGDRVALGRSLGPYLGD